MRLSSAGPFVSAAGQGCSGRSRYPPGNVSWREPWVKVFISWSGEPSRSVALALRQWLPLVVQHVKPWMSDEELASGTRWNDSIASALEETDFGIICVTAANQHQPWLVFEAGALAKRLELACVVPLCIDVSPSDITGPLAAFQWRRLNEDGMRRLVQDISKVREQPLESSQIDRLFDALWPQLNEQLDNVIGSSCVTEGPRRSADEMLEELVESMRNVERFMSEPRAFSRYVESGALAVLFNDKKFVELVRKDQYLSQAMAGALKRAANNQLARQFIKEISPIRLVESPVEL
jgi:TIR domain